MKKQTNKVRYNYIFNLIYQVINVLVQVILLRYLSYVIGSEGIGIQSYTNSIVTYFAMFIALGINWYGQKEIAQRMNIKSDMSRCFWELVSLKILWSFFVIPLYILFIIFSSTYKIYYIASAFVLIAAIIDISWLFQGIEKFDIIAIRNSVIKLLGMLLILIFVRGKEDTLKYILILSITNMLGNVSIWSMINKEINFISIKEIEFNNIVLHFKNALQYFIPTIAVTIYTTLDKTMIGIICENPEENGYYEQAIQISNMLKIIVLSYSSVMMSRMTLVFAQKQKKLVKELFEGSMQFIIFISWPVILGVIALARDFCSIYFESGGYNEITDILLWFSPLILIVGLSNIVETHLVTPMNHRSLGNKIVLKGLIANVILNSVLIPLFGGIGAAIASVISEIFVTINYVRYYPDYINWKKIFKCSIKKAAASVLMYMVIMFVRSNLKVGIVGLCVEVFVGVVVYVLFLFLLRDGYTLAKAQVIKKAIICYRKKT